MSLRRRAGVILNVSILALAVTLVGVVIQGHSFFTFHGRASSAKLKRARLAPQNLEGTGGGEEPPPNQSPAFNASELRRMFDEGRDLVVVDIRSREQFAKGYIPSSINIPQDEIHSRALDELPDSKLLIISNFECGNDEVSRVTRDDLVQLGFTNTAILAKGIDGWKKAGFETKAVLDQSSKSPKL